MNNSRNEYSLLDVFDNFFTDMESIWALPETQGFYHCQYPPLNLYIDEKSKDLKFEFALAGYTKDEIDLQFEGDYLKLEINPEKRAKSRFELIQKGIKESKINKRFYVPNAKYQVDKIDTVFKNGILSITIPAKEELKAKRISIK